MKNKLIGAAGLGGSGSANQYLQSQRYQSGIANRSLVESPLPFQRGGTKEAPESETVDESDQMKIYIVNRLPFPVFGTLLKY